MVRGLISCRYLIIVATLAACAPPPHAQTKTSEPAADTAELWQEPVDLLQRDLFAGPGGAGLAPSQNTTFAFVSFKTTGTNPGYTVRDPSGRLWSVKLGVEAQSEVTASRILWALGFHQPATYYLPEFTMDGLVGGVRKKARFRTDVDPWRPGGEWSWYENPFAGTQPFRGLVVAQLILNAWDLKTPNNRIYFSVDPSMRPSRQFMVRDVGSSLGAARQFTFFHRLGTRGFQGSKNDLEDFEQQGFITAVEGNRVRFDYRGVNQALVNTLTVGDVVWTCELFARIPDGHWEAAFRAGNYTPPEAERYITKIKEKIAQGLALRTRLTH
ncbi:MAG TPA: hypothetical protein VJ691_07570 [Vicinamibacterales bacterium]|nr:hypothetical protein [Vicinamibacterales bacterium]